MVCEACDRKVKWKYISVKLGGEKQEQRRKREGGKCRQEGKQDGEKYRHTPKSVLWNI